MVVAPKSPDLSGIRILMLAPCLGKFGGIETFCLTLIGDLLGRGASVRLLRKKVAGFDPDGSIEASETEIQKTWKASETREPASLCSDCKGYDWVPDESRQVLYF